MSYPVHLKMRGRRCAVVGGGNVAWRRVRALLSVKAKVTVIAPEICDEMRQLVREEKVQWVSAPFSAPQILGMFLVICATNDEGVNRSAAWAAKATGSLVNMAAPPLDLSDFIVPAQARAGDLVLTVSTTGKSPELSRVLCRELERDVVSVYAPWLDRLTVLREEAQHRIASSEARAQFWRTALDGDVMQLVRDGNLDEAEASVRDAIGRFGSES